MRGFLYIKVNTRLIDLRISMIKLYNSIFSVDKNTTFSIYLSVELKSKPSKIRVSTFAIQK